nr:hypothetical protein CoNPh38_CDS0270 [Staphylococcus phage S-CoN_Ph38]
MRNTGNHFLLEFILDILVDTVCCLSIGFVDKKSIPVSDTLLTQYLIKPIWLTY